MSKKFGRPVRSITPGAGQPLQYLVSLPGGEPVTCTLQPNLITLLEKAMNSVAEPHRDPPNRRLTRSAQGMIAGVCSGLSECWGVNLIFTRLAFVVLGLFNGIGLALYVILMLVIPASPIAYTSETGLVSTPRSPTRTAFTWVAGLVSVGAGMLAFFDDLSYIFQALANYAIYNR